MKYMILPILFSLLVIGNSLADSSKHYSGGDGSGVRIQKEDRLRRVPAEIDALKLQQALTDPDTLDQLDDRELEVYLSAYDSYRNANVLATDFKKSIAAQITQIRKVDTLNKLERILRHAHQDGLFERSEVYKQLLRRRLDFQRGKN